VPLIFVEHGAGITKVGPPDNAADELMLRGLLEQPTRLVDARSVHDGDRAIEAIALQNWMEQRRRELGSEVLVGVDTGESAGFCGAQKMKLRPPRTDRGLSTSMSCCPPAMPSVR